MNTANNMYETRGPIGSKYAYINPARLTRRVAPKSVKKIYKINARSARLAKQIKKNIYADKHHGHTFFRATDFTKEEIARKNELAIMVLNRGTLICKYCGLVKTKGKPLLSCREYDAMKRGAMAEPVLGGPDGRHNSQ